jgi:hypothetical protein
MTNNLILKSSKLFFQIKLNVVQDFTKFTGTEKIPFNNDEVIVFSLSPNLYPIKTFDQFSSGNYLDGFSVFMFRKDNKSYLFLDQMEKYSNFDLQMIFTKNMYDNRTYCEIDYLNVDSISLKFFLDFSTGNFHVYYNDKNCINYRINQRLFYENKAALTITGYSSQKSPVQFTMSELSIFKEIYTDQQQESFHSSITSFNAAMEKYNPLHQNNTSITNLLLIQGKIKKEIFLTKEVLELLTLRTDNIVKSLDNANLRAQNFTNVFFEDEQYVNKIETQVKVLEEMITSNDGMSKNFQMISKNFENVNGLFDVIKEVNDVNDYLSNLDQLMELSQFDEYLDEMNKLEQYLKENNINIPDAIEDVVDNKISTSFSVSSFYKIQAILLVLVIIVLVIVIVRKINEKMKHSIF